MMDNFIIQKLFSKYGFVNFVRRPSVCAQPSVDLLFLLFGFDRLSHLGEIFIDCFLKIFIASCPKGCENLQKTSSYSSFADIRSVLSHRFIYYFSLKIFLSPTLKGGKILTSINKMSSL